MNAQDIKLCVTLNDDVIRKLKYILDDERQKDLTKSTLFSAACQLEKSGKPKYTKIATFIRDHIDDLVKEYSNEYPLWEARALSYAEQHKHGIPSQLIENILYDKIWKKNYERSKP